MVSLNISSDFGYVLAVGVGLYLGQQIAAVIPVVKQRLRTNILAPTLYPRDSEVKEKKLSEEDVTQYMCAQRAHQNNVELMSVFMPIFLATGLVAGDRTRAVGHAGLVVLVTRLVGNFAYATGGVKHPLRKFGGMFHLGELYVLYVAGTVAWEMLH